LQQDDQSRSAVLERRESGKTLSDSVTEQSDDSSVTQDDSFEASFAVYSLHPSEVEERALLSSISIYRKKKILYKYIVGAREKGEGTRVVTIEKRNDYKEPTILSS
jgi:hypothetical protein